MDKPPNKSASSTPSPHSSSSTKAPWPRRVAGEILAGVGLGLLYPFALTKKNRQRFKPQPGLNTVVLIHGYLANPSSLLPIYSYLRLHGVSNLLSFRYKSRESAEGSARKLKQFLADHVDGGRVDFVGHSLGGIIARIYIQMLGGYRRSDRCITLGSPHAGTYNAYWVPSRIGEDLRPESILMKRLRENFPKGDSTRYISISGTRDNIILPRSNAKHQESHCVEGLGHLGLLWSPKVMKLVLDGLKGS
jgi:triacylglycerol lipase